jgi:four helix bundle protein
MPFKFEKLEVWREAVAYIDLIYTLAGELPRSEDYNLKSQITRAATSVALNIAEGSISQTNDEQARLLGLAIRSLVETVACQHVIHRRKLVSEPAILRQAYKSAETLVARLHTMRRAVAPEQKWLREPSATYEPDDTEGLLFAGPIPFDDVTS